ncbi:MAG: hypothetical protein VCC01_05930 [Candidatus Hydrogenedentota bacterium]
MTNKSIEYRLLDTLEEYQACIPLQRATWGQDFSEVIPAAMLKIANEMGGIAGGAFTEDNQLAGFIFGVTGIRHGKLAHWSDMLAVYNKFRGCGIGQQLKRFQRDQLLERDVKTMYWTYDPLEAPNANLNWNHLGVKLEQYIPNMYGDTVSPMHSGLPTDRMLVEWCLDSDHVLDILAGERPYTEDDFAHATVVELSDDTSFPESDRILIEIPKNIQQVKEDTVELAMQWRIHIRNAFQHYLVRNMQPVTFLRRSDSLCFYALVQKDS